MNEAHIMYRLGRGSLRELEGVDEKLVAVVKKAITITSQDFTVHDGIRTVEEQRALVRRGASKTMNSKHIIGKAVDLVPYVNGKLRWEWNLIYPIAEAMREAANELDVVVRWGGCWNVLTYSTDDPETLVNNYVEYRRSIHKRAFIDGPHYELFNK